MLSKAEIIERARSLGFEDVGFTTAAAFETQVVVLEERKELYAWAPEKGLDLAKGVDPKNIFPGAKSIIVLIENYFRESFPTPLETLFGRCYLDDDRVTKDGLSQRIKGFRGFLRENGIETKVPFNVPHRLAAARAGLGTFGKNCLFYAHNAARRSSWTLPIAVLANCEFEPDQPTIEVGCPEWCRNACITACPTRALLSPRKIDPRRCISYLTYYGEGITPVELREPMGMWIYGCDRCQNVCPRNQPWLTLERPINEKVANMQKDFELPKLLHMDLEYYKTKIWPRMFYMSPREIWRWKMNVARAMGNSNDSSYIPDLIRAFRANSDERVRGMIAWALGRLSGAAAKDALLAFFTESEGVVKIEVSQALERA